MPPLNGSHGVCIDDVNCSGNNGDKRTFYSAEINHLLYYNEKTISVTSTMITGFLPPPPCQESFSS